MSVGGVEFPQLQFQFDLNLGFLLILILVLIVWLTMEILTLLAGGGLALARSGRAKG